MHFVHCYWDCEKSRGCNGIALSHCLWLCKQAEVAMTLHLVIASEFAAERTSCGPKRNVASRGCTVRNRKIPRHGSQLCSLLLSISVSLSLFFIFFYCQLASYQSPFLLPASLLPISFSSTS